MTQLDGKKSTVQTLEVRRVQQSAFGQMEVVQRKDAAASALANLSAPLGIYVADARRLIIKKQQWLGGGRRDSGGGG